MKEKPISTPVLLTLDEVAAELHVTKRTLRRYVAEQNIPVVRITRKRVYIERSKLDRFLQSKQA